MAITPADDLEMMRHPERWPLEAALPLKRMKDSGLETGMLVVVVDKYDEQRYVFVPDATVFEVIEQDDPRVEIDPNLENLVNEGWMVD